MSPRFERHFATEIAETARLPRANARELADTGQVLEAQALEQFGADLTDISAVLFKWNEREGSSQFDTSRGLAYSRIGEHERTNYADSTELEAGKKKLEADLAKIPSANGLKNKSGRRKFKAWLDLKKEEREKISAEKTIRMIARNGQIALFKGLTNIAQITDEATAMTEIDTLIGGGLDDGSIKTAAQALSLKDRFTADWATADLNRKSQSTIRADGEVDWTATVDWLQQPQNTEGIDSDIVKSLRSNAETQKDQQVGRDKEALEIQRETDRGTIYDEIHKSTATRAKIEGTSLGEDEQSAMWEMAQKEAERKAKGELIITDPQARSRLLRDTTSIITGAKTRAEVMRDANDARFGNFSDPAKPTEPTIDEDTYGKIVSAIEAQYEQGFGQMMSRVYTYAEGILLNPDSLGFIKNAPVRHRTLGDFQEAWLRWVAEQGDKLKLSDIYPEGRRLAASYQISDIEAERQENVMQAGLRAKEQGKPKIEQRTEGETIQEYLKRTGK